MRKNYFPLSLDITGKKCVVIGGGKVGWQKAEKLLRYGADITLIARDIRSMEMAGLVRTRTIRYLGKKYSKELLRDALLVFAATNDTALNAQIQQDAEAMGIMVNVADDREKCRFISTAIIEQDGLQISIATHGKDSLRSRKTRQHLERNFSLVSEMPLKVGSRSSALALRQASEFFTEFQTGSFVLKIFQTAGDKDKTAPIERVTFFDTLETALRKKEIDLALHSAKDVDAGLAEDMEIFALSESVHPMDALVIHPRWFAEKNTTLDSLPKGARIGASGIRRRAQLQSYRSDLELVPIRGNIDERLALIEKENLDGIIIAMAALNRLGLDFLASEIIPESIMSPHPLQGKLAIEIRKNDVLTKELLTPLIKKSEKWSFVCPQDKTFFLRSFSAKTVASQT